MLKRQKKIFSLFLTLCLILSCFVSMANVVYADEEEAKTVTITALPEFHVGASVADAQITVEAEDGVDVKTVWTIFKPGFDPEDEYTYWFPLEGDNLAAHPTFQSDTVYELTIESGDYVEFAFSEELKEWEDAEVWSDGEGYFISFGRYSDTTEITKVEINAPEPAVGETAIVESVSFYDEAGNVLPKTASTSNVRWVEYTADREEIPMDGQVYEAEKAYYLVIEQFAATGYTFPENITLVINGEEQETVSDPKEFATFQAYSLFSPLKSIEISGLPAFEAGEAIPAELKLVSVNTQHSLSVDWYVEGTEYEDQWDAVEAGKTFEAGKTYRAAIWFQSGEQPMADDFYFVIDGKQYAPTEFTPEYQQAMLEYQVTIPEEQPEATPEVEDDTEKAPTTGDNNTILPFAVLITASSAFLALRKKSANR